MFQLKEPSRGEFLAPQVRVFWPPGSVRVAGVLEEFDDGIIVVWSIWVAHAINQVINIGVAGKLSPAVVRGVHRWGPGPPRITLHWTKPRTIRG